MRCRQPVIGLSIYGLTALTAAVSQGPRELRALENWQIPFAVAKLDPWSHGGSHRDQSPWRETPLVPGHLKVLKGAGQDMKPKLSFPAMTPLCSGAVAMPGCTLRHWVPEVGRPL